MSRTITQYNLEAKSTPAGRRYLAVIIEEVTQADSGVWGLAVKVAEVASFPCLGASTNPWGDSTRHPAERFMWALERAA